MRVLIVGGSGFLGNELVRQSAAEGHVVAATCLTRPGTAAGVDWLRLDVRDRAAVVDLIGAFSPDVVVNAAFRQSDWVTTAVGAAHVAIATAGKGGRRGGCTGDARCAGVREIAATRISRPPAAGTTPSRQTSEEFGLMR
ncbi:NAD-dependent epimerase/dehydratase family protein [Microbispora sp. H10830]|uniref:NAD-dependent epimerase/dehydratase family protein n=1 Tax=Microbispora sp. H10830 TaxID=2729109 RepID=UPI0015FFF1B6|nr:sugar nucleotide-binding protein [Microbispora sp. H10830]